ncbi:sugar transferase [Microbacterium shaanxiense]
MTLQRDAPAKSTAGGATPDWQTSYARRLVISDLIVVAVVVFGTQCLWLGIEPPGVSGIGILDYTGVSIVLLISWMATLSIYDTRSRRVLGFGNDEYRAIASGALRLFGLIAIVSYLLQAEISRGYILISLPLGVVVLVLSRWGWRRWLGAQRRNGGMLSRVLLVGDTAANLRILSELSRQPEAGYVVVGACLPTDRRTDMLGPTDVPVFGDLDTVTHALDVTGADTVLVSSESGIPAERVRALSWELEAGQQHLIMAPNLTDIGGPRIHMRPVAGLPLMHVETPNYTGPQVLIKRVFDLVGSGLLITLFSPLLLVIAVLVRATSAGPALYGQERVGLNGKPFKMMKFRSMIVDADAQLSELLAQQGRDGTPLFKVESDPRVTKVGRFLRKYSLDELPQLFNVFLGTMSLVGPRPQRDGEVALYDDAAQRRLIVKPGMSGLWQVSGRSALSWEDAIRLDLYYVENWSLTGDVHILFRTLKAVIAPGETAH